ncbi:MAG: ABC-F family ATP-binding cassette domain-containing protein [Ignavibacteriaceae bacterium]|nr:ABC-F family ATP-binding cassette domain-containing protein [Ignavibacteriaceae bacterium]
MLQINNITFSYPGELPLLQKVTFSAGPGLTCITGKNGSGKSTLFRLITGELQPQYGSITCAEQPWLLPQTIGKYKSRTIGQLTGLDYHLEVEERYYAGKAEPEDFIYEFENVSYQPQYDTILKNANIRPRQHSEKCKALSNGELMRLLIASMTAQGTNILLLDEPTNHLDKSARMQLLDTIYKTRKTFLVITHDRFLLDAAKQIIEIEDGACTVYTGNYDLYKSVKQNHQEALIREFENTSSELRKLAKNSAEVLERQAKGNKKGKHEARKSNVPRIMRNKLKQSGEQTLASLHKKFDEKIAAKQEKLQRLREQISAPVYIKPDISMASSGAASVIVSAAEVNFSYGPEPLWKKPVTFVLRKYGRIHLQGSNGSGKTTLIRLLLRELDPQKGDIHFSAKSVFYLDQSTGMINDEETLLENLKRASEYKRPEHELRIIAGRMKFYGELVFRKAESLSGGEKMRLALAMLISSAQQSDLLILDEPMNNLDLATQEILAGVVRQYQGAVLCITHDTFFPEAAGLTESLDLDKHI